MKLLLYKSPPKSSDLLVFFSRYWLLSFYILSIAYLEFIYRIWSFKNINSDYFFPVIFSITAAIILFLLSSSWKPSINKILSYFLLILLIICYGVQLMYFCIFHTPLSFYSLTGADDAIKFNDIIFSTLANNILAIILLLLPLLVFILLSKFLVFNRIKRSSFYKMLLVLITSYAISIMCVNLANGKTLSQRSLYYDVSSPELSASKLGLMTTMRLDIERLIFGFDQNTSEDSTTDNNDADADADADANADDNASDNSASAINSGNNINTSTNNSAGNNTSLGASTTSGAVKSVEDLSKVCNIINIDFKSLIAKEKNKQLLSMHKYFSALTPSKKNKYTDMFKGNNLILITAESFSPYAISKELTPTLYKMSTEGFVFKKFYNPVWGVSTSDGEYVACTGLIPISGVWSFAKSGNNFLPFVMGNQFKNLGYGTKAYHDHTYTYYKRNISHPNMGYDFRAVGNGLNMKKTWPESDVEMINKTAGQYISQKPFHTYYMTVSGHMNYSFTGNYIAYKNKAYVSKLKYSEPAKAYIAANLEFEFAMKTLLAKLEAAGIADKTVIAISPDHYPYGLPRECIDELAGHKVENNFELYKSSFILWKKGMTPVTINKPCASLDIIPTLSNLFGLKYDSRLLIGNDILSDFPSLVIFSNRSWITDHASYNSLTNTVNTFDASASNNTYIRRINKIVANKFKFSAKILETDYYRKALPDLYNIVHKTSLAPKVN
jgi:lipoteichoic acid synthase